MLIDRMTRLDKSSRVAVYATLLVISAVAMYGQIVSPHLQYLKAVQNYEPAIDQMVGKQVEISSKLVDRRKVLEDLQTQFDAVGNTVFTQEKMKAFFGGLEPLAEASKCSIAGMEASADNGKTIIGDASDPCHVESVEMTLTVLGEYRQLTSFIDALQHQDRQIWLTSVDIEMMKDQERVLKCDITIKLYVLQEKRIEVVL